MNWLIEEQESVVIIKMSSNKLNLMNDTFFNDLNNAFDTVDADYPQKPVVLTSVGNVFSAGFDLNHCFPIFENGDPEEILEWFEQSRSSILRVFKFDRPLIGAINGHAIAAGLILSLCCDMRFAVSTNAKFGLNEVTIGFPMPVVFAEIIRFTLGNRRAEEMLYKGILYNPDDALKLGVFHDITDQHNLMDMALGYAAQFNSDNIFAYSAAKNALRGEIYNRIENTSNDLDKDLPSILASEKTISSLRGILDSLKKNN